MKIKDFEIIIEDPGEKIEERCEIVEKDGKRQLVIETSLFKLFSKITINNNEK